MIGNTLGSKYTIVRQLGEGGMGAVYEARHTGTGRRVAVKVITGELARDPELVARFELEARAAGAIESEHIAQVLDVGRDEGTGAPFLVMEFLVGEDLSHLFERLGPLLPDVALRIGVQACVGLAMAHAQGIVHRDIKPANLFLSERDSGELRVKVLDFGIAKMVNAEALPPEQKKSPLTRMGTFLGSPFYMSPEQTRGSLAVDHRTDIWSLGIVLYQALAGRTPFEDAPSIGDFIASVCTTRAPSIRLYAPWVDPAVAQAVERALAIDPAGRYASVAELRAALEAFLPQGASIRPSMLVSARPGAASLSGAPTIASTPHPGASTLGTPHPSHANLGTPHPSHANLGTPHPGAMGPGTPPPGLTQPAMPIYQATVPGQPAGMTPGPMPYIPGAVPNPAQYPYGQPAAPTPPRASSSRAVGLAVGATLILVAGGLGAAFALGWIGSKPAPAPIASAAPSASAPRPADTGASAQALAAIVGTWKSDAGVIYDAVPNGESVELRIRDPESLATNGYVAGDTHFALRPLPGEPNAFRVAARIRPPPPKGYVYDKARSRTTCENTWRQVGGKQLRAELQGEKLVVGSVRVDAPAAVFTREGNRVVGCTGLAEAPVVEIETVLTSAAAATPTPPKVGPVAPKPDAGAPVVDAGGPPPVVDAGGPPPVVDAGGPPPVVDAGGPPPVVDAGGPPDPASGRPVGAACRRDGHCASHNCTNLRCQSNTPGSMCVHNGHCASRHCIAGICR